MIVMVKPMMIIIENNVEEIDGKIRWATAPIVAISAAILNKIAGTVKTIKKKEWVLNNVV